MKRRTFAKALTSVAILPALSSIKIFATGKYQETTAQDNQIQLCGRNLTGEEKLWMEKFLADYKKSMENIKETELQFDVLPGVIPKFPEKRIRKKSSKWED